MSVKHTVDLPGAEEVQRRIDKTFLERSLKRRKKTEDKIDWMAKELAKRKEG